VEKIELTASKRGAKGKKAHELRLAGKVPAVVYGRGVKSESLQLDAKLLERVYRQAGGNKIVSLKVGEDRARNVLIHEVQKEPYRGELMHVDFYVVKMDEALKTEVPLHYTGESTAVYKDEGTLVKNLDVVEIECLPKDLPDSIEVDISVLDNFEKSITLGDLSLPKGVKLTEDDLGTLVAKIDPPRSDAEMAELDEAVSESEELPEGVKEEEPVVLSEQNEGDKDRGRDKK
jgi:large subunit ribosomal protein L25